MNIANKSKRVAAAAKITLIDHLEEKRQKGSRIK